MKRLFLYMFWMVMIMTVPVVVQAQNYDRLWKEVEELTKKDLPRSVVEKTDEIYSLALESRNLPQMMKSLIVRAEYKAKLSPDSVNAQMILLRDWAENETDITARAVLNSILAKTCLEQSPVKTDSVLHYFRLSLTDKETLSDVSAEKFHPVVISEDISRMYFNDNMYDFLARQAINGLISCYDNSRTEDIACEIISIYDSLISLYSDGKHADRAACALTEEARLVYLSDYCKSGKYRISYDESVKALESLSSKYKDLEVYCDIALKLADKYRQKERFVDAVSVIDKALALYPETRWTKDLKGMKDLIMQPSLNIRFSFVYPGYETDMTVNYKNLTDLKVETYRLALPPSSPYLHGDMEYEDIVWKYGSRVSLENYSVPPTPDYKDSTATLKYKYPQAGIYMLKLSSKVKGARPDFHIVNVTPYQCVVLSLPGNKREFVAVDCLSGNPVPGAEIVFYKRDNGNYEVSEICKTDKSGSIIKDMSAGGWEYVNVRTPGNDYMPITNFYNRRIYNTPVDKERVHTSLFTDRSIFRPGQTINVSGVKYRMDGDSVSVERDSRVSLTLRDSNWKEIVTKEVTTDAFGVYSYEFVIPDNAFPGYYSIMADDTQTPVRVEEYKRPTFDVNFDELKGAYTFNDSVKATAIAETFAGAPVGMSKVQYRITRGESFWWRYSGREEEIASGETMTGADGRFEINFKLEKPDSRTEFSPFSYCRYNVVATVTSPSGETQEGIFNISLGDRSLGLSIEGLSAKVVKEKNEKIRLVAMNLNSTPVETEINYTVYGTDEKGEKSTSSLCSGKHISNKSFIPEDVYSLPSGSYVIEMKAVDDKGRECTFSQSFVLFSLNDTRVPVKTVDWFWQDGTDFTDGKPVDIYVGTSETDLYVMVDVFTLDKRISSERIILNDKIRKFRYEYSPEYGDGISVRFTFMRKGRLYTKSVQLLRPQPDKKLEIRWDTFRDKLLPGQNEVWKLSIKDSNGNPVEANLLASAYDASLDKVYPHDWHFRLSFRRDVFYPYSEILPVRNEVYMAMPFSTGYYGSGITHIFGNEYTHFMPMNFMFYRHYPYMMKSNVMVTRTAISEDVSLKNAAADVAVPPVVEDSGFDVVSPEVAVEECMSVEETSGSGESTAATSVLRENFKETAFYYPMLRTDSLGVATLSFVVPEALTEWKFNGFAHTRDMDYGSISATFTTSKPFMVQPNMPRFVRTGDNSSISTLLINMSDAAVSGKVSMIIENPLNGKKIFTQTRNFSVAEGESGAVTFHYEVDEEYDILACSIIAEAGEFSDGERHYLPVLSDKQMVVENTSIQLRGNETKTMEVKELFNSGSLSAENGKLRIEMTANPQWHIISSLPVLSSPVSNDAISWATAFYANSLSRHIVRNNPKIKTVFDTWMQYEKKSDDFLSELKRNEELKNIVMSETPWLVEAENDEMRKQQIAFLFDDNGMNSRLAASVTRLKELQMTDGSWSWFGGMTGNRYITTQIAVMIARLKNMGVDISSEVDEMYSKSIAYLRSEVYKDYLKMIEDGKKYGPIDMDIKYLYICSIDKQTMDNADKKVNSYIIDRLKGKSPELSIYEKSIFASIMSAGGQKQEAKTLLESVMEYMVQNEEMGAYFDTYKSGYTYMSYRIPSHVAAMEAIIRLGDNKKQLLDGMKLWLLKQKQVQLWETPVASVDAIYAFLVSDGGNLDNTSVMTANIGTTTISTPDDAIGFIGRDFTEKEFKSDLKREKNVSFTRRGYGTGWISVYTSYLEKIEKIRSFDGKGLDISRKYLLDGKEIDSSTVLEKGDKITVRINVESDRDMDFVCIKDSKAACMEQVNQLSAYQYSGGLSYYKVNKDSSTEFFIDKMRKGSYTIEYEVYVTRSGTYTSGVSSIISVYAPQFGSHTGGQSITVR